MSAERTQPHGLDLPAPPLLLGEPVAARPIDEDRLELFFGPILLGVLDGRKQSTRFVCAR